MTLNELWLDNRPIYNRLPGVNGGYKTDVVAWLTAFWDEETIKALLDVEDFDRQVDPDLCDEQYLDFLAGLFGWSGIYWNSSWPTPTKRTLLSRSFDKIWINKGSRETLTFIITAFGIPNLIIEGTSFIIGQSEVGDQLGDIAWEYVIYLPTRYFRSPTEILVRQLDKLFSPVWTDGTLIFDDQYFGTVDILATGEDTLTATGTEFGAIAVDGSVLTS